MAIVIVLVVVLLAVVGGVLMARRTRTTTAEADAHGSGPDQILEAPPTSLPSDDDEPDDDLAARFNAPGARSTGLVDLAKPMAADRPVFHLEQPRDTEPSIEPEEPQPAAASTVAVVEPEPVVAEAELVGDETTPASASDDVVIDLVDEPESSPPEPAANGSSSNGAPSSSNGADSDTVATNGAASNWADGKLQPEPDAVDHVLQALITRARFKQVDVEEVASELVERADLQGVEVSEVLAELVGRADGEGQPVDRTSELTLFNDAVPSRPGQLTDFAQLAPADKKRIIVRVLCLLVARSEDQQLPPREEPDGAAPKSWPLARAVWPLASTGADADAQLPSRRLAQSG